MQGDQSPRPLNPALLAFLEQSDSRLATMAAFQTEVLATFQSLHTTITAMRDFHTVQTARDHLQQNRLAGCVDRLRTVRLEEFPDDYPQECCICIGDFATGEVIVVTDCRHVFHKVCCQEWLRQARTCPVCRMDIPSLLVNVESGDAVEVPPPSALASRFTQILGDFEQQLQIMMQQGEEERLRQRNAS